MSGVGVVADSAVCLPKELIEQYNIELVPEEADYLKSQISSLFDCTEIFINDWAPVAGVHCRPGVIGISFYTGD